MFNKTLLALAVAGVSLTANAGILTVNITEGAATATATALEATSATEANEAVNACALAATTLGVVADPGAFTPDNAAVMDVLTVTDDGDADVFNTVSSVTYTGTDACTVVVADATVSADDSKYSQEGAESLGLTVTAKQIAGIGGVQPEDTIIITVSGATIDEDESINAKLDNDVDFDLLGVDGDRVLFTYTGAAALPARSVISLTGLVVTPVAGSGAVSLSSAVQNTANVQYDKSPSVEITKIAKQYSAKTYVAADGIIDVATERFDFEANTSDSSVTALGIDGVNTDSLVVQITENTTLGNLTPKSGELVITGNFSWMMDLDADEDGKLSATEIESGFDYSTFTALDVAPNAGKLITAGTNAVNAGKSSLNTDMTELTIPVVVGGDTDLNKYQVVTFKPVGKADATVSLETTKFIASLDFINDKATDATASDVDLNVTTDLSVGEWTLNGSVVEVPYMPFGPSTQPIIRHTNTGAQTGDISVRYMVEELGGVYVQDNTWQSLGVIVEDAKPGVRNLLTPISDALKAKLGGDKFKVALEITTNVPGDDVTVYAAAKVTAEGQDRLTIGAFKGQ
ncbi:hypothetical protein [Pseudoalteromonas distincta]|uniref:hypothetical protein n=1 Tax=Pseudoalteromonas distincta TaxID=77608 RepID=UPI0032E203A4